MRSVDFGRVIAVLYLMSGALASQEAEEYEPLINWDLVSLEQNNPRFNGSVLTGFHSIRSPGVTPYGGLKLGLGMLYTKEDQVSAQTQTRLFEKNQLIVNPKINYGFFPDLEAGAGVTASYASGKIIGDAGELASIDNISLSSADLGLKWKFFNGRRLRFGLAFDTRIAINRGEFGNLPGTLFNFEIDSDFAVTNRFSLAGNLQFLTSDSGMIDSQVMGDIATLYSFTDQFRGLLFGTIQEDDASATVLGFVGIAGQYAVERHSFTLAFDLLLNDAGRTDIRTEGQIDIELSYTYTFQ